MTPFITTRTLLPRLINTPYIRIGLVRSMATSKSPVQEVLSFWFKKAELKQWFMPDEEFDVDCRSSFGDLVQKARREELEDWRSTPDGSLALLILLDQIPRNIFRGSGESFSSDGKASDIAIDSIAKGFDHQVEGMQQLFFYLPLMHGESLLSQIASLSLCREFAARLDKDSPLADMVAASVSSSQKHLETIQRFGRFPARNAALGRKSTPEEEAFLKENPKGL